MLGRWTGSDRKRNAKYMINADCIVVSPSMAHNGPTGLAAVIRTAFVQPTGKEATAQWRDTGDRFRERFPKLGILMDRAESDVLAFTGFPKEHWVQIAITHPIERVKKEIKRRSKVIEISPNDGAIPRLVGALVVKTTGETRAMHV